MYIYDHISLSSWNEKCSRRNSKVQSKHTFYVQLLFAPKIVTFWDNVEKNGTAGQTTDYNKIRRIHIA